MTDSSIFLDDLECGLCFDRLLQYDGLLLPCNHRICLVCHIGLERDRQENRIENFKCPRCKIFHALPIKGANFKKKSSVDGNENNPKKPSFSNVSSRAQSETSMKRSKDRVENWLTLDSPVENDENETKVIYPLFYINLEDNKEGESEKIEQDDDEKQASSYFTTSRETFKYILTKDEIKDKILLIKRPLTERELYFLNHSNVSFENTKKEMEKNKLKLQKEIHKKLESCIHEADSILRKFWDGTINRRQAKQKLTMLERRNFILTPLFSIEIAKFQRKDAENSLFDDFIYFKNNNDNNFEENINIYKFFIKEQFNKFLEEINENFNILNKQLEFNKKKLDNEIIEKLKKENPENGVEFRFIPKLNLKIGAFKKISNYDIRKEFLQNFNETLSKYS